MAVGDLLGGDPAGLSHAVESGAATAAASHVLYVKGSPEVIKELVQATSVPPDFDATLAQYTREGLRVLALAQGPVLPGMLPEGAIHSYSQQQLEGAVPLHLMGLAVLSNPLRPDSAGAIQDLQNALVGHGCECSTRDRTACVVCCKLHSRLASMPLNIYATGMLNPIVLPARCLKSWNYVQRDAVQP